MVTKGMEGRGGNWMMVVRRYKLLVLSTRDEMYMMTIVNTALMLYLKVTKTINLVLITGKKKCNYVVMDVI